MKFSDKRILFEQGALLFASFVWTTVVLTVVVLFWVYRDIQTRWEFVLQAPPEALAQAAPPTPTSSPTATLWPGPGPTLTPTATQPPTPTATWVIQPPNILPETLNPDDPTPIPVIVEAPEEAVELGLEQPAVAATPSPTPEPTQTATQPAQDPALIPAATAVPSTSTPEPTPIPEQPTPTPVPTTAPAPTQPASIPAESGGGNQPTRLVIDSVGVDAKIVPVGWSVVEQNGQQYSIWQVADQAVGWHKTSAGLGQPGNSVMTGHHNVNGEVFRDLVNIEVGDKVVVYGGEKMFEYVVELKTIVKEKGEPLEVRQRNAQWIAPTADERLTFVTCWPYTNNTHRVIVVAKPS